MSYKVRFVVDELAWADRSHRARILQIIRDALANLKGSSVQYTHKGPEHHFTFAMDGFGWNDRRRAGQRMQTLLDALTRIHIATLRRWPRLPGLYESGVRYEREPPGREDWQDIFTTIRRRGGDCEDLATWRASEGLVRGLPLRAIATPKPMVVHRPTGPTVGTLWHIRVRWPGGRLIEDPSLKLGMSRAAPEHGGSSSLAAGCSP